MDSKKCSQYCIESISSEEYCWVLCILKLFLSNLGRLFKTDKARSKFKQAVLSFIATQIVSNQDKEELQNTFKILDKDGDGKLTRDELIEGFVNIYINKIFLLKLNRIYETL